MISYIDNKAVCSLLLYCVRDSIRLLLLAVNIVLSQSRMARSPDEDFPYVLMSEYSQVEIPTQYALPLSSSN